MTDERIKEEFETWWKDNTYPSNKDKETFELGFTVGFKTAERLAKIEVLEEMKKQLDEAGVDCFFSSENISNIIAELKASK